MAGSLRSLSRDLLATFWVAFLTWCAVGVTGAAAWGAEGHRLIAELAESKLTPAVAVEVRRLLAQEPDATMVSVSTWADQQRSGATASMHYVNLPEGDCTYDRRRDCADGRCVVEALSAKVAVLTSRAPDAERLAALKWIIHLTGDIHQPLHVGVASDKGGNLFQVRAFGRGSNLHAVWDGELIRRRAGGLGRLLRDASVPDRSPSGSADPARWANESCAIRSGDGFYPQGRLIDTAYATHWDVVLVAQIGRAGLRLAGLLNAALQSPP